MKSLEECLELDSLAETIMSIGYRAKVQKFPEFSWIASSANGYNVTVVAFTDGIKLRATFDYISEFSLEVVNQFNIANRLCKMFILEKPSFDTKLCLDLDCLLWPQNFDQFVLKVFQSFEVALAAFDRVVRGLLEQKSADGH